MEVDKVNHFLLLDALSSLSPGNQAPAPSVIPLADYFQPLSLASFLLSYTLDSRVADNADS